MNDFKNLINELQKFRDARHWEQFHNTKDLALAISIESAELNELFLWKTTEESEKVDKSKIKKSLLISLLRIAPCRETWIQCEGDDPRKDQEKRREIPDR